MVLWGLRKKHSEEKRRYQEKENGEEVGAEAEVFQTSLHTKALQVSFAGLQQLGGQYPGHTCPFRVLCPKAGQRYWPWAFFGGSQCELPEGPYHTLPAFSSTTVLTQECRGCLERDPNGSWQLLASISWSEVDPIQWRRQLHVHHNLLELTCTTSATSHLGKVSVNLGSAKPQSGFHFMTTCPHKSYLWTNRSETQG